SFHPLASVAVPDGAMSFSHNSGSIFMYVVKVAGEYDYECQVHFSQGMTGKFIAADVNTETPVVKNIQPMYIVAENGQNVLYSSYNNKKVSDFTLNIFDETGRMVVGTTLNAYNTRYVMPQLPRGMYIVRVADNESPLLATQMWQP